MSDADGASIAAEAPLTRMARVRRAGTEVAERPVVALGLCVAGRSDTVEFTLADRTEMDYRVLVGRNFLAGRIVVDAARTLSAPDACERSE